MLKNETPKKCILRELNEEINIEINNLNYFINIISSAEYLKPTRNISYYYINLTKKPKKIKIFEGQNSKFFSFQQLGKIKINPFDYAAISMFYYLKIIKKIILKILNYEFDVDIYLFISIGMKCLKL